MSLKVYGLTELSVRRQKLGKDVLSFLNNVELNYQLTLVQETDHMYYKNNLPLLVSAMLVKHWCQFVASFHGHGKPERCDQCSPRVSSARGYHRSNSHSRIADQYGSRFWQSNDQEQCQHNYRESDIGHHQSRNTNQLGINHRENHHKTTTNCYSAGNHSQKDSYYKTAKWGMNVWQQPKVHLPLRKQNTGFSTMQWMPWMRALSCY